MFLEGMMDSIIIIIISMSVACSSRHEDRYHEVSVMDSLQGEGGLCHGPGR